MMQKALNLSYGDIQKCLRFLAVHGVTDRSCMPLRSVTPWTARRSRSSARFAKQNKPR
jgi:hypothetical protein